MVGHRETGGFCLTGSGCCDVSGRHPQRYEHHLATIASKVMSLHPGEEMMNTETALHLSEPRRQTSGSPRKRINTTDLMQGAREVVLLHEGEEYVLRITKAGKLILTK